MENIENNVVNKEVENKEVEVDKVEVKTLLKKKSIKWYLKDFKEKEKI